MAVRNAVDDAVEAEAAEFAGQCSGGVVRPPADRGRSPYGATNGTGAPDDPGARQLCRRRNPKQPTPDGQTLHGDHAYVFYQIPVNRRKLPLVFLHGTGQFSKTWETTPDGREGFQTIFLRRRFPVYLIDQPRRGNAGRGTVPATIEVTPDEQAWFDTFRIAIWPEYFPGVQFSRDPEALNQYFRQMTPNVGAYDPAVISDACAALFNKIGPRFLSLTRRVEGWDG